MTEPATSASAVVTQLIGLPSTLKAGDPPVEFTAVLSNPSNNTLASVAPLFQIVGGNCNCVNGTLQRLDAATGSWHDAPMPEGDGGDPALAATVGEVLPAHGTLTVRYRLTVSVHNSAKPTQAVLYAIGLPDHQLLGQSKVPGLISAS